MNKEINQIKRRFLRYFFETDTGELVVGQRPNIPLILFMFFIATTLLTKSPNLKEFFFILSLTYLLIWSLLEIISGVNRFRRLIGMFAFLLIAAATRIIG